MVKPNSHLPQQKVIYNLFLPQGKGYKTTHLVDPQGIRRFDFFLQNDYSKAFAFHQVLLARFLRNKNRRKSTWYVKMVFKIFSADMSLKKIIHQFSLLRLNIEHQHSIRW